MGTYLTKGNEGFLHGFFGGWGEGLVNPRGGKVQPSHKHKTHVSTCICFIFPSHGECVYKIKHIRHMCVHICMCVYVCIQHVPSYVYNVFPLLRESMYIKKNNKT